MTGFSGTRSINDSIFLRSFLTVGRQTRLFVSSSVIDGERDLFIERCSWEYIGDIIGFERWEFVIVGEHVLIDVDDDKLGVRLTCIESFSYWLLDSISIYSSVFSEEQLSIEW